MMDVMQYVEDGEADQLLEEQQRDEIERAIDNVKRSARDKWFRREFYRAAARNRWPKWKRAVWRARKMRQSRMVSDELRIAMSEST